MPTACIISLSRVCQEPRVIRQARLLRDMGCKVVVAGYEGGVPVPAWWSFVPLPAPSGGAPVDGPSTSAESARSAFPINGKQRFGFAAVWRRYVPIKGRQFAGRAIGRARWFASAAPRFLAMRAISIAAARGEGLALKSFWATTRNRLLYRSLQAVEADFFIAHDWFAAPLARRLARRAGAGFSIDIHEYARMQFSFAEGSREQRAWLRYEQPYIDGLQSKLFKEASVLTTVCDGIAGLVQRDYGLPHRPVVVRSTPFYQEVPFRPAGGTLNVLYHGMVWKTRGLDHAILSLPQWRPEFRLIIRGEGPSEYLAFLKRLATEQGVSDRVHFEPPVPFSEIVSAANRGDIGYMVLDNYSPQRLYTLPNKFFEYVMAGLALCVSDLPEMARIVRAHDLGVLVNGIDPAVIARAINSFDRARIDAWKRKSLETARALCWEKERVQMADAYLPFLPGATAMPPSHESFR